MKMPWSASFDSFNNFTYYTRQFNCSPVSIRRIINVPNAQSIKNRHRFYKRNKQLNRYLNLFPAKDSRFDEGNSLLICSACGILTCTNANNQTETSKQKKQTTTTTTAATGRSNHTRPRSNTRDTVRRPTQTLREIWPQSRFRAFTYEPLNQLSF